MPRSSTRPGVVEAGTGLLTGESVDEDGVGEHAKVTL